MYLAQIECGTANFLGAEFQHYIRQGRAFRRCFLFALAIHSSRYAFALTDRGLVFLQDEGGIACKSPRWLRSRFSRF
jgi:hypothetical protein